MVYQHFMLVPSLTVTENLVIGMGMERLAFSMIPLRPPRWSGKRPPEQFRPGPGCPRSGICPWTKQKVEILKVLIRGAKNPSFSTAPTAVLTPAGDQRTVCGAEEA